jgi:hypothetical protein
MNTTPRALLVFALSALPACLEPVATVEREYDVGDVARIVIDDEAGDIEILGEAGRTTISVVAQLRSDRASRRDDDEAEDAIELDYVVADGEGRIAARLPDPPDGYHLDLVGHVPADLAVKITDDHGDIVVGHVASIDIEQRAGDLDVFDVAGDAFVHQGTGDISISDVGGRIEVTDGSGDISISGAHADVLIDDGSGDISVRADGTVDIVADEGGDVDLG